MSPALRPELRAVLEGLLADSAPGADIPLDALGDALGTRAASSDEIDAMIAAIEATGRTVGEALPTPPKITPDLKHVLAAVRALTAKLGRRPTAQEIADASGLELEKVRRALALAQIMAR